MLTHLQRLDYCEVEFIVLTHPHRDHYSGLQELLEYIETKQITVHRFAHTLTHIGKGFWKYFEVGRNDTQLLRKIMGTSKRLKNSGIIRRMDLLADNTVLEIEDYILIKCMAPSHDDMEEYMRIVKMDPDVNSKQASQAANLLSAVFHLDISGYHVLLTSDAEIFALQGIIERDAVKLTGRKFKICQLPHHGSIKNHHKFFWDLMTKTNGRHAVISAGKHRSYSHPSYKVVAHFHDEGYQVHCTNIVNGMEKFLKEQRAASLLFDTFGVMAEDYMKSIDHVFEFRRNRVS